MQQLLEGAQGKIGKRRAAGANFAVLLDRQSATGKGVFAKLLDAQSCCCWEEKQLLCSVEEIILTESVR